MSEFPDDMVTDQPEDTQLVKDLRKQLREASKSLKERDAELSTYRAKDRQSSLADLLKSKGVSPKVAALIPSDVDSTEDAITAWLGEYGEALNITPSGDGGAGGDEAQEKAASSGGVNADTVEALRKAQSTEHAGTPAGVVLGMDELNKAMSETDDMSFDEAIAFLADKGLSQPGHRT